MLKRKQSELVSQARILAIKKHMIQVYADDYPYIKHLEEVVNILIRFGYTDDLYIIAGYLHDILEDTDLSYNDIKTQFGVEIADVVYCVTDELGKNRKERKSKTLPKIKSNEKAIVVKLADRIANLENGVSTNGGDGFLKMYKKENVKFKEELFIHDEHKPLWDYIDDVLSGKVTIKINKRSKFMWWVKYTIIYMLNLKK